MLRRPRPSDTQDRLACGRDPELIRLYGGDYRAVAPLTPEDAQRWYEGQLAVPYGWVIEWEGRCIGTVRLHSVDAHDQRASLAIGLFDRTTWGQGLGTEAIRLVLGYAFQSLRLHRVSLRVLAYNTRAIRAYEKCGFVREGVERESALVAGEWHDDVMMAVLDRAYRAGAERE